MFLMYTFKGHNDMKHNSHVSNDRFLSASINKPTNAIIISNDVFIDWFLENEAS